MLPVAQLSCTPSVLQMNCGAWSGMQPLSTQTRPVPLHVGAASAPLPGVHVGTQC
jgi:hypothetical protein